MEFDGLMKEVEKIEFKNIRGNAKTQNSELRIENDLGSEVIKIEFPPIKRIDNLKDLKVHLLEYKEVYKKIADIDRNAAFATYRRQELNKMANIYFQAAILSMNEAMQNLHKVKDIAQKREAFTELVKMVDTQINELEENYSSSQENDQKINRYNYLHIQSMFDVRDDRMKQIVNHFMSAIKEEVDQNGNVGFKNWEKDFDFLVQEANINEIKNIKGNEEKICELWRAIDSGELGKQRNKEARFNKMINLLKNIEGQLKDINEKLNNREDREKGAEIREAMNKIVYKEVDDSNLEDVSKSNLDLDKYPKNKYLNLDEILRKARSKSQPSYSISTSSINPAPSRNKRTQDRDAR